MIAVTSIVADEFAAIGCRREDEYQGDAGTKANIGDYGAMDAELQMSCNNNRRV
jgi:hypothetical protein